VIIFCSPSNHHFSQQDALRRSTYRHCIFVCGRYEGIDQRFCDYFVDHYPDHFKKVSIGRFVTMGGETPAMVMTEAITRLIPGVIKEEQSRQDDSYTQHTDTIE
jgi:tRNA (guanine37-N1)-methyltransferase